MALWYRISDTEWIQAADVTLNQYGEVSARIGAGMIPSAVQIAPPAPDDSPAHFGIIPRVSAEAEVNQGIIHGSGISARPDAQLLKFDWLGKVGCWIQTSSVNVALAYNPSVDYFICMGGAMMDQVTAMAGGRPVVLAVTDHNSRALVTSIPKYVGKISAIMWDYECDLDEQVITDVKDTANFYDIPLGINMGIDAPDAGNIARCGFTYGDAAKFCDFSIPQYYCQWLSNHPAAVKLRYDHVMAVTPVPMIPVVTVEVTTSDPTINKFNPLSPATIQSVYGPLGMKRVICWNVKNMDATQWAEIESVLV